MQVVPKGKQTRKLFLRFLDFFSEFLGIFSGFLLFFSRFFRFVFFGIFVFSRNIGILFEIVFFFRDFGIFVGINMNFFRNSFLSFQRFVLPVCLTFLSSL